MRQPPLPEGHTNTRIQHANYVAARCTLRYYRTLQFNSIRSPSKGGERTLAGRLVQEMRGLTSMTWNDKYAR